MTDPLVDFIIDQGIPQIWSVIGEPIKLMLPDSLKATFYVAQEKLFKSFGNATLPSNRMIPSPKKWANNTNNGSSPSISVPSLFFSFDWDDIEQKVDKWGVLALKRWHQFSVGRTSLDRSMCILVGYLILICLGSLYLAQMKRQRHSPDSSFQELVRQQGMFLKVFFFFVIEMLIFPTACGLLLDMTTLPLFAKASIESRYDFQLTNPFSSLFLHWFLGTGVLFYFANFITVCREIIRPGVLWYIRDPNDPQFHPIQEMVDKPFSTLLYKIGYSAFAYAFMIIFGVGTVTYTLALTNIVFPLRLSFSNPLCSTVAFDFLAVQFLLPPLIMLIKPREHSKKALDWWWHFICRQLRLTSYMFNVRMADEEGHHMRRTLKAWLTFEKTSNYNVDNYLDIHNDHDSSTIFQPDGMLVRVPKYDSVSVDPTRRMLVPVDPVHFQPIDQQERGRKHPAAADTNDEDQSTIIVYIPPFFYQRVNDDAIRICLFVYLLTFTGFFSIND
jgi:E3 ubiquitin-protein ligase DOA10